MSGQQLEVDGGSQVGRDLGHRWQREGLVLRLSLHSGKPRLRVDKAGRHCSAFLDIPGWDVKGRTFTLKFPGSPPSGENMLTSAFPPTPQPPLCSPSLLRTACDPELKPRFSGPCLLFCGLRESPGLYETDIVVKSQLAASTRPGAKVRHWARAAPPQGQALLNLA